MLTAIAISSLAVTADSIFQSKPTIVFKVSCFKCQSIIPDEEQCICLKYIVNLLQLYKVNIFYFKELLQQIYELLCTFVAVSLLRVNKYCTNLCFVMMRQSPFCLSVCLFVLFIILHVLIVCIHGF